MHPHLADLTHRSAASTKRIVEARAALSPDQIIWRPDEGTWSFLDCLEHLVLSGDRYAPFIGPAIESGNRSSTSGEAPYRPTWFGKLFIRSVGPDGKRAMRAPGIFKATGGATDGGLVERFVEVQTRIGGWIRRADGVPLNGPKFRSPVTFLVRLTIGEGLTLLVAHTERHVNQALALTRRSDFPAS